MRVSKRVIETEIKTIDEPPVEEPKEHTVSGGSQNYPVTPLSSTVELNYSDRRSLTQYFLGDYVWINGQLYTCLTGGMTGPEPLRAMNQDALSDGTVLWSRVNEFNMRAVREMFEAVFERYIGTSCTYGQSFLIQGEEVGTVDFNGTLRVDPKKLPLIRRLYQKMQERGAMSLPDPIVGFSGRFA